MAVPYYSHFILEASFAKSFALYSRGPCQCTSQGIWFKWFSLECLMVGSTLIRKKAKFSRNDHSQ